MITPVELPPDYKRELDLQQLGMTLSLAEIRCLTWTEIRPRLQSIWNDPQADEIILRVQEIELSKHDAAELAAEIGYLSATAERLHDRDRSRADRRLVRLSRGLPQSLLYEHALSELSHRRKLRRVGAYRVLRDIGVNSELAGKLVARYTETRDQDVLRLIARSPDAVSAVDAEWLLSALDEQYWRMRVIEGLILTGDSRSGRFIYSHAREFVHAVGRTQAKHYAAAVRTLIPSQSADWELVSLVAWALGRLGERNGLAEIRELLDRELAANPPKLLAIR